MNPDPRVGALSAALIAAYLTEPGFGYAPPVARTLAAADAADADAGIRRVNLRDKELMERIARALIHAHTGSFYDYGAALDGARAVLAALAGNPE